MTNNGQARIDGLYDLAKRATLVAEKKALLRQAHDEEGRSLGFLMDRICSYCKKWMGYRQGVTDLPTHGVCPPCKDGLIAEAAAMRRPQ